MKLSIRDRYSCLAIAATAAVATAVVILRPEPAGTGITEANFDRIEEGMTQEDVERIVGCPPGDYTEGRAINFRCGLGVVGIRCEAWVGYKGTILLDFREGDGRLERKVFTQTFIRPQESWFDRID